MQAKIGSFLSRHATDARDAKHLQSILKPFRPLWNTREGLLTPEWPQIPTRAVRRNLTMPFMPFSKGSVCSPDSAVSSGPRRALARIESLISSDEIRKFSEYVQYFKKYAGEYNFDYLMIRRPSTSSIPYLPAVLGSPNVAQVHGSKRRPPISSLSSTTYPTM